MRNTLILLVLVFTIPFSITSHSWDSLTSQIVPEDVAERPPQVFYNEEFENETFNRENFYNKSAGTRQYRQTIRAPKKDMNFEVYNPVDDPEAVTEEATPQTGVVEKDGKAVTVISIGESLEAESKSK
ncbi:MAG: hypothetical protein DHS20C13_19980 [Thermodesulfobacteriota bacterium]|nr:MAG: hypothetical protein DHS20C13_19980 [Thermodesulfobacteriota bacterium]